MAISFIIRRSMVADANFVIGINIALGAKVAPQEQPERFSNAKLLVIEDHALVQEGLVQTLRQLDTEVTVMENGRLRGWLRNLALADDFDLVLLDLALPGIDGLTCLGLLRQRYPRCRS